LREAGVRIFAAKIYQMGPIRWVDVPEEVSKELGETGPNVLVCGTVDGVSLKTTLVPRGGGLHRMAIHGDIYKKLRIDAGAVVEVALELDEESREPALPPVLVAALRQNRVAQETFRGMTTALRRQIVRYLVGVKQQATLERRVAKFMRRLEEIAMEKKQKQKRKVARKAAKTTKSKGRGKSR
jgi:Bacteriocin-protection, YdeI or OmpD-Associated/Domain of unknown function (DUF1905)